MTAPDPVQVLTDQLIVAWWEWDQTPGDQGRTRRCTAAEKAFEQLGVNRLDLVRAIQANRRGSPDVAGMHGSDRQKVADAVQTAVNDLVPPQRLHDAQALHPDPYKLKEAS